MSEETKSANQGDIASVSFSTWAVVFFMSLSWALSFYPVLVFQAISDAVAAELHRPDLAVWFIPSALLPAAVLSLASGANTDLLGRRWFIVSGAFIATTGLVIISASKTAAGIIAGMAVLGIGSALAQVATFAIAELLPNKWRHVAAMLSEGIILIENIVAPVTARYAFSNGTWRWNIGVLAIFESLTLLGLLLLYYPPPHPYGIHKSRLAREIDYLGITLYTIGAVLVLIGLVWAGVFPSNDNHVVYALVSGFILLTAFALWETFGSAKHPLTPPNIFALGNGRDATAPLITLSLLVFFFYGSSILWPSMIQNLYTPLSSIQASWHKSAELSMVQGFGIACGALLQSTLGRMLRHWKWQLTGGMVFTTLFGALLALVSPDNQSMIIAIFFLAQMGYGWKFVLANATVQLGVPHQDLGIIGGLANTARNAGGSVSTVVYSTILKSAVSKSKKDGVTDPVAYVHGYRTVALASIAFGSVAIIASLCCRDVDEKMDERIEVRLRKEKERVLVSRDGSERGILEG